ncbi:MAG TPA: Do family serine endopeptidase, partial [Crenotrichaceae bacterium]|nr:Do family serine endopeptidase [Crenotrichaceae bacterium]
MKIQSLKVSGLVLTLFLIVYSMTTSAALPLLLNDNGRPTLAPMLEQVMPAVVNISTQSQVKVKQNPLLNDPFFRRFFNIPELPQKKTRQSLGSGVIVNAKKGYILTNNHVIANADKITVTLHDKRHFEAKVIGFDPESDLAVVQIEAKNLSELTMANSSTLQVGDFVVAIGNPFGLEQTVTSGIISALGRSGLGIEGYENFIQTDASINPGNSGGALVDLNGQLIGINTAIIGAGGSVGIGFAIPSDMAHDIMTQLIQYGEVHRGRLGVTAQDLTHELAEALGIEGYSGSVIAQVGENSPADKGGLKVGDVVTAVNGKPVHRAAQLRNAIGLLRVGSKVSIDIIRNGKRKSISITIEEPKQAKAESSGLGKQLAGAILGKI